MGIGLLGLRSDGGRAVGSTGVSGTTTGITNRTMPVDGVWVAYRAAFAGAYDVWPFSSELHALRTAVRWADAAVVFVPFGHVMSDVIAAAAAGTA